MNRTTGTGKYEQLLERCKQYEAIPTAVAHPCEEQSLAGAIEAGLKGLITPILVGPQERIREVAKSANLDLDGIEIVDAEHSHASAAAAVAPAPAATATSAARSARAT